jgi:hypothetical protein
MSTTHWNNGPNGSSALGLFAALPPAVLLSVLVPNLDVRDWRCSGRSC